MARKRKKSKSKKRNRRSKATASPDATPSEDVELVDAAPDGVSADADATDDLEVIDLDAETDGASVDDLLEAASALADEALVASADTSNDALDQAIETSEAELDETVERIEPGDEVDVTVVPLDDHDDITTISLDDDDVTVISLDDEADEDAASLIAQALHLDGGGAEDSPAVEAEGHADVDPAGSPDSEGDESDDATEAAHGPVMTPDALAALRDLRTEGVGSVPTEVVLDLGEGGTPEDRDRLLQAALAHVEMQDAVYRVPTETGQRGRFGAAATALVLLAALWVAVAPPSFIVPPSPPAVTDIDRLDGVRIALWLQAQQVEAFRVENGRLPEASGEIGGGLEGIRYVRSNSRQYQLVALTPNGRTLMYDSTSPDPTFAPIAARFSALGGSE